MPKQVTITVNPDGSSVIDAEGFAGKGCGEATASIELALAGSDPDNRSDKKKREYWQTVGGTNAQKA